MGFSYLTCDIDNEIHFDRKHYFYPDLPKGYQISQYKRPICSDGYIETASGTRIDIERIHQEEDVAKSTHHVENTTGREYSLIDYNKSGVPLIEIVTKPCIRTAKDAKDFATEIRKIARYLGISDADMEKGQMRCEPNISLQEKGKWEYKDGQILPIGDYKLNSKVEVKNIGSITAVEKSIQYEVKRLTKELEEGKKIEQQTRGWNAEKNITEYQRTKETADDYRYMPEPDIPVVEISDDDVDRISEELVPLPSEKKLIFTEKIGITDQTSELLTTNRQIAETFERLEKTLRKKTSLKRKGSSERGLWIKGNTPNTGPQEPRSIEESTKETDLAGATGPAAADFLVGPVFSYLNATGEDFSDISDKLELFAEVIEAKELGEITRSKYDEIIQESLRSGQDPNMLLEKTRKESLIATGGNLTKIVREVIQENSKAVEDYRGGKQATLGFLVGQVMQATKGAADPNEVRDILIRELKE